MNEILFAIGAFFIGSLLIVKKMRCKMKTVKKIFKTIVNGYLNGFKESAEMMYGHLYK